MALKDLLVYVDQTEEAPTRLRLAADLARRHSSHLTALFVREWTPDQALERRTAESALVSANELDSLDRRVTTSVDSIADGLQTTLAALRHEGGLQAEWRCVNGLAAEIMPQQARYADLCILGQSRVADGNSVEYSFSEQMLFLTGRPVLFVPGAVPTETLGRHIVVAWNSSRAAARAVNDALPLIERAEHTTVLMVDPAGAFDQPSNPPGEKMVEHLRRHSAVVDFKRIESGPTGSIAGALQAEAHSLGADLLVAGAFGHPKLWEKLLGGVTRDLLDSMSLPLLMSH